MVTRVCDTCQAGIDLRTRSGVCYDQGMNNHYYIGIRMLADRIGLDPWDVSMADLRRFMSAHERAPVSRFWFGSPCRFVRAIDAAVHVWLPAAVAERFPMLACYLRSTSPRWGKAWRSW